ncbi:MAG: putative redox protein [Halanaerobiales bacterium]|nr:putative redox protein [Halanaerobiales bacterium]
MKSKLIWKGDLGFVAKGGSGHEVIIDAAEESGGHDQGPRPMELLLHGLAGCTAIDVVLILKKMKVELTDFSVEVEGERAEEHPRRFTRIHLKYKLKGKGLTEKNISRAINLSQEKYCSASNSFNAEITSSYEFENIEQGQ